MKRYSSTNGLDPNQKCFSHWVKNFFCWDLCDRTACRRARACRGLDPRRLDAVYRRVPPAARAWFRDILALQANGHRFTAASDRIDLSDAEAAFCDRIHSEIESARLSRRGYDRP